MPALDSEALDFRVASELFSPVRKLTRTNIATLRLLTTHQGRSVPTVGGLLLFGQDRLDHFPDAWIQAGRFAGTDKAAIIDQAEFKMSLIQAIEEAIAFVEKHSLHGAVIGRLRRRERWSLPPAAVREAIVNAVAHADYSQQGAPIRVAIFDDRLEVENPGLLPFGLTLTDLPHGISKAAQSSHRPRAPRVRAGGAMGKWCSPHARSMSRIGLESTCLERDRRSPEGYPPHRASWRGGRRSDRPLHPRSAGTRSPAQYPRNRRRDRTLAACDAYPPWQAGSVRACP